MSFSRSLQKIALFFLLSICTATTTLSDTGGKLEELINQLKSDRAFEREQAAEALGYLGDPQAIAPLIEALKDPEKSVSDAASQALENYDDPRIDEALTEK